MPMKKMYRDPGNQARMFLAMFLLALVYLAFLTIFWAAGVKTFGLILFAGFFILIQFLFSGKKLPVEKDLQKWYPMWDIPI